MKEASVKKLRGLYAALFTNKVVRVGIMGVIALVLVTIFNTAAFAQNDVGTIVGQVTDQTGAVIPNATVTVTHEGTGATRTILSDASGRFTAPNVAPGMYTVAATAAGFEKFVSTHNNLQSNSTVEVDAKLQVGAASQTVQVTDTAQVLQTQSATVQSEINGKQVTSLELNGRNPIYLTSFVPGAVGGTNLDSFNWSGAGGQDSWNINGARTQDVEVWYDGAPAIRTRDDGEVIGGVNTDSVQEVQVLTADYSAEYGTGSGGEIRVVTKSGTRDFHGTLFEYIRNSAAIANTWSRKESASTQFTAPFRYNNFGFTVGGPVWIPRSQFLSKTRDKAFFFMSQDWYRLRQLATYNDNVPTLQMRQGDFTQLLTSNPWYPTNTHVYNPVSCVSSGSYVAANCTDFTTVNVIPGYTGSVDDTNDDGAFNGTGAVLPNSVNGMAFMNTYPTPTPGYLSGTSNWEGGLGNPYNQVKQQYNMDIMVTPNQHIEFRRSDILFTQYAPTNNNMGLLPLAWNRPNQTNALGWEWTIKPTMINEMRATVSDDDVYIPAGPPVPSIVGEKYTNGYNRTLFGFNFPYIYPTSGPNAQLKGTSGSPANNKIPTAVIPGFNEVNGTAYPSQSAGIIYALSDSLTYVMGNHTLKFGMYVNKMGEDDNDQINVSTVPGGASNENGQFTMSNDWTGVALANTMMGLSDNYAEIGARAYTPWRGWMWEEFGQDNWQVTPKLHLDYGFRLSTVVAPYGIWANSEAFDPASYNVANTPTVNPVSGNIDTSLGGLPFNGLVIPGFSQFPQSATQHHILAANPANWTNAVSILASCENEPCSNLFAPQLHRGYVPTTNELQPRFGFAYQLSPTTVLRGGAGRFTQDKLIIDNIFPGGNSPFQPTVTVTPPTVASASNPNPNGGATSGPYQQMDNPGAPLVGTIVPPLTVTTFQKKTLPPSRYDWNFSYQQQFTGLHSTLNVAYVGAVGNHNWQAYDLNQPTAGSMDPGNNCQTGYSGFNCPQNSINYVRPYRGFSVITQERSVVNEKYKGLQIGWNSHFPDGASLGVTYSGGTTFDGGSAYRDIAPDTYYNLNLWGQSDYNIRSALLMNWDYPLPFLKGRHDAAGEILGGWEISGANQFQTGTPSSVVGGGDYAGISTGGGSVSTTVSGQRTYMPGYLGIPTTASGSADGSMSGAGEFWSHTALPAYSKHFAGLTTGAGAPQWFAGCGPGNASACGSPTFNAPTFGTFVTQPGVRNIINNPGLYDWNLSAIKTFPINESNAFEFHADVYNVTNHPDWSGANFNATSSNFGEITGKSGDVRTIQLGLKYRF